MKKSIPELSEQEFLLTEIVLKISAMERLLVKSGIFTTEQLSEEMSKISKELIEHIKNSDISNFLFDKDLKKN